MLYFAVATTSLFLLIDILPGNSLIQELLSNIHFYLLIATAIVLAWSCTSRLRILARIIFCTVIAGWMTHSAIIYLVRKPLVHFAAAQQLSIEQCLQKTAPNVNDEFFHNLTDSNSISVQKFSDTTFALSVNDVWTRKDYYIQSIMLRRFAKVIRHDEKPFVVLWRSNGGLFSRKFGGFIFQARLRVIATTPDHVVLARYDDGAEAQIESACL